MSNKKTKEQDNNTENEKEKKDIIIKYKDLDRNNLLVQFKLLKKLEEQIQTGQAKSEDLEEFRYFIDKLNQPTIKVTNWTDFSISGGASYVSYTFSFTPHEDYFKKELSSLRKSKRWYGLFKLYKRKEDDRDFDIDILEDLIMKRISDVNHDVRYWAIRVVGKYKISEAIPKLIERLAKDRNQKVRSQAAWSLGLLGDSSASTALIDAKKSDKNSQVRMFADKGLMVLNKKGSVKEVEVSLIEDIDRAMTEDNLRALSYSQKKEFRKENFWTKHGGEIIVGLIAALSVILQIFL